MAYCTAITVYSVSLWKQVGATKADRKTRRPEWNQNFTVRWDLVEPDPPPDDEDDDISMMMCHDPGRSSCSAAVAKAAARAHLSASGGEAKTDPNGASCRCNKCRRRGIELELEVWHQYDREDVGREDAKSSSPAGNEPKRPSSPSNSGSSGAGGGARQPNTEANRGGGGLNGLGKAGGGELVRRSSKPDTLYGEMVMDIQSTLHAVVASRTTPSRTTILQPVSDIRSLLCVPLPFIMCRSREKVACCYGCLR